MALATSCPRLLPAPWSRWLSVCLVLGLCMSRAAAESVQVDSAVLQLFDEADLAAGQSGILVELSASEGQSVKRGDVIARIDDTDARITEQAARAELALAKAKAENDVAVRAAEAAKKVAEAELARSEESIARFPRSVSQSQLDVERLSVDKLKLEVEAGRQELELARLAQQVAARKLEAAQLEIRRRRIIAPIDAVVVEVETSVGEWMEPGQRVVRLVNTDRLKAEGFVSAAEAAQGLLGWRATVHGTAGTTVEGKVVFVSPEIDPINNQVRVWAEVQNPTGTLRPGQPVGLELAPRGDGTP